MKGAVKTALALTAVLYLFVSPTLAEKISLRFSICTSNVAGGDIDTWLESFTQLWQDWQNANGGSVQGLFSPLDYGTTFDVELRIPIVAGFALNLSGSRLSTQQEDTITYQTSGGAQTEQHLLGNQILALPFKVGISYSLPLLKGLHFIVQGGRQIVFVRYENKESYQALFQSEGREFSYWFEKDGRFRSEALGYYASISAEFDIVSFLALSAEAEKTWSNVSGFKGPYNYRDFEGQDDSGEASLYFYESNQWDLDTYYTLLTGHLERPQGAEIRNLRQGELSFSGFSFKMGLRIKF